MKFDASHRRLLLPLALASLTACSSGSAIIGVPDAAAVNDLGGSDLGASDAPEPDAAPADLPALDVTPEPRRTWTIFVYGHADHSLSGALETDINEMSEATFGDNINIVVMADFDATQQVQGPQPGAMSSAFPVFSAADATANRRFPMGTTWYRIRSRMPPEVIRTEPEKDMDDPRELTAAMRAAFQQFPADRYGLVLWDHGGSWDGGYGGDNQEATRDGALLDGGMQRPFPTTMTPAVAANAVRAGIMASGLPGERPLEFVSFDTCLMGTAEVIREFEPLARVFFGAAEIDYGDGWDYNRTLTYIAANPGMLMPAIAAQEVMHWNEHHSVGQLDLLLRSHVAVDLSAVAPFVDATRALSQAVIAADPAARARVARHGYFSVPGYHIEANALAQTQETTPSYRDLAQFLGRMQGDAMLPMAVRDAAMNASQRLIAATLGVAESGLRRSNGQGGIHIAFPAPDTVTATFVNRYRANVPAWQTQTSWAEMLQSLQAGPTSTATSVTSTAMNLAAPTVAAPPTLTITPRGDVAEVAAALVSVTSPTTFEALEFLGRQPATDNTPVNIAWDGLVTVVAGFPRAMLPTGDASVPAPRTQSVTVFPVLPSAAGAPTADQPAIVGIPGVLIDRNVPISALLLCLDSGARALTPLAFNVVPPRIVSLRQATGLDFVPVRRIYSAPVDGGMPPAPYAFGTAVVVGAGIFGVAAVPAPAGTYILQAQVNDVYGRDAAGTNHNITLAAPFVM